MVGFHVFGDAGDVGPTCGLADAGAQACQIDIGDLGREQMDRRMNIVLAIEDRTIKSVLDAIHTA